MSLFEVCKLLCNEIADATEARLRTHDTLSERAVCADVAERLQRRSPPLVCINEPPYPAERAKNEAFADLKVYYRHDGIERRLWLEVKPLLYGSNYWNFSKFFDAFDGARPHASRGVILDDIEKRRLVPNDDFALVLILANLDDALTADVLPPAPRSVLRAGQVFELCRRGMEHRCGKCAASDIVRGVIRNEHGCWPFDVVALIA